MLKVKAALVWNKFWWSDGASPQENITSGGWWKKCWAVSKASRVTKQIMVQQGVAGGKKEVNQK